MLSSHIKFTPNSRFILCSTQDSTVRLWNTQASRCVKTYKGHTNRTYSLFVDFAPGGKQVVCGSEDCKVYLWDLQSRQIVQVLEGHRGTTCSSCSLCITHIVIDVVITVAVRIPCWSLHRYCAEPSPQSHPHHPIIASASMEKDLSIRIWHDVNSPHGL